MRGDRRCRTEGEGTSGELSIRWLMSRVSIGFEGSFVYAVSRSKKGIA